jgi:hypothetical protein
MEPLRRRRLSGETANGAHDAGTMRMRSGKPDDGAESRPEAAREKTASIWRTVP